MFIDMMVVQRYDYTERHGNVQLKIVNFLICELHLNQYLETTGQLDVQTGCRPHRHSGCALPVSVCWGSFRDL